MLLNTTIKDNIIYGSTNNNITDYDIWKVAKSANAVEFIVQNNYDLEKESDINEL